MKIRTSLLALSSAITFLLLSSLTNCVTSSAQLTYPELEARAKNCRNTISQIVKAANDCTSVRARYKRLSRKKYLADEKAKKEKKMEEKRLKEKEAVKTRKPFKPEMRDKNIEKQMMSAVVRHKAKGTPLLAFILNDEWNLIRHRRSGLVIGRSIFGGVALKRTNNTCYMVTGYFSQERDGDVYHRLYVSTGWSRMEAGVKKELLCKNIPMVSASGSKPNRVSGNTRTPSVKKKVSGNTRTPAVKKKVSGNTRTTSVKKRDIPENSTRGEKREEIKKKTAISGVIVKNGFVKIPGSGPFWQKCSLGQSHMEKACNTKALSTTWEKARNYCRSRTVSRRPGRLPTLAELKALISKGDQSAKISSEIFPNTEANIYWTASPYEQAKQIAVWVVDFRSGNVFPYGRDNKGFVRCVADE